MPVQKLETEYAYACKVFKGTCNKNILIMNEYFFAQC